MRRFRNTKGFTLIELMIVVVIIGILAALAIPRFNNAGYLSRSSESLTILKQLCTLANAEKERTGNYPATDADIPTWSAPAAKYYSFAFAQPTATATKLTGANVISPVTINCDTGVQSPDPFK